MEAAAGKKKKSLIYTANLQWSGLNKNLLSPSLGKGKDGLIPYLTSIGPKKKDKDNYVSTIITWQMAEC